MENKRAEIKNFFENDEILGELARKRTLPTLDIYGKRGPFLALVEAIISQQLSGKAASAIYMKFEEFIEKKEDVVKLLAKAKISDLRRLGISNSKAESIISLSQIVYKKEIKIENLKSLSDEEIKTNLTKVKGIGVWTANMFLMFGLKREDIWPFTDYGIRKNLSLILGRKEIMTKKETEEFGKRWKPYRSYASCYIWNI